MSDLDKPKGSALIQPSNGKHHSAPPATGEPIALPPGFWRGCTADGIPRDPSHPWFWNVPRKKDA
jgi:hypothetical protein